MKQLVFSLAFLSMILFLSCEDNSMQDIPEPEFTASDIVGNYRDQMDTVEAVCNMVIRFDLEDSTALTIQYFPFMWPFHQIPMRLAGDKVFIDHQWSGNISSPGGHPREYASTIRGTGVISYQNGILVIEWDIDYAKTGFLAEIYNRPFEMYLCE